MDKEISQLHTTENDIAPRPRRYRAVIFLSVGLMLAVLALFATTYLLQGSRSGIKSSPPTTTQAPNPTNGWETYSDAHFSIKYPPTWSATTPTLTQVNFEGDNATFVINTGGIGIDGPRPDKMTELSVTVDGATTAAKEFDWNSGNPADSLMTFEVSRAGTAYGFRLSVQAGSNHDTARNTLMMMLSSLKFQPVVTPTAVPGGTLFYSKELGISFSYAQTSGGDTFTTKQVGNRIYWVDDRFPNELFKFVEVFPKNASDTIQQAITKAVLGNYDPSDCPISLRPSPKANAQRASLSYNSRYLSNGDMVASDLSKCPTDYTAINWDAYFQTDTTHPTVLLFFNIGQDDIPASVNTSDGVTQTWDQTVSIL